MMPNLCNAYTSYFAAVRRLPDGLVPVSISLWPPRGWQGLAYQKLAPTSSILREYKETYDWKRYCVRYCGEVLFKLNPAETMLAIQRMCGEAIPVLVCFEKDNMTCHRSLIANWFTAAGIQVAEWR